jgi:GDP-L-fucose synthase
VNKNSKIFIAGHNGLVGSAVQRLFKSKGYKNLITISRKNLDLKDKKKVANFFKKKKIEYIIIAAAKVGGIMSNNTFPVDFFNENILIQNSLLNCALDFKIKKTVFLGSSCIYPCNSITPIKEEYFLSGKLEETNRAYALAKIAGIELCRALYSQYRLPVLALMPTNMYGINDKYDQLESHVLPAMLLKFFYAKKNNLSKIELWGDGKPEREFLSSDDLANAIYYVLKLPKNKLDKLFKNTLPIINIGTGDVWNIKDLAYFIKNKFNYSGKIIFNKNFPNGTIKKNLDSSKILSLGWKPKYTLLTSIDNLIKDLKLRKKIGNY